MQQKSGEPALNCKEAYAHIHVRQDATDHRVLAIHETEERTYFVAAQPKQSSDLHGLSLFSL